MRPYGAAVGVPVTVIIDALVGVRPAFPWFWDFIFWGSIYHSFNI